MENVDFAEFGVQVSREFSVIKRKANPGQWRNHNNQASRQRGFNNKSQRPRRKVIACLAIQPITFAAFPSSILEMLGLSFQTQNTLQDAGRVCSRPGDEIFEGERDSKSIPNEAQSV
jgi:hypothetical protein